MSSLEWIKTLLAKKAGFKVDSLGPKVLDALIKNRMAEIKRETLEEYYTLLVSSPEELHALMEQLIPPETWFFRHPKAFEEAVGFAKGRRVGAASLGCSSGEEPYSLVMALLDAGLTSDRFAVEGWDFNRSLIVKARKGLYSDNAFRSPDLSFRQRYFDETSKGFLLKKEVRDLVIFREGNILEEEWCKGRRRFDLIFCRHLLIYFTDEARERLFHHVKKVLKPDGCLFVGPSETTPFGKRGFQAYGSPKAYAFRLKTGEERS